MKAFGISILALFIVQSAFGQYFTPGTGVHWDLNDIVNNSAGVMTFEDGKYLLWNGLHISLNDTISISTDEDISVMEGVEIKVYGVFISEPPLKLYISAMDTTTFFKGFSFDNSDASILRKTNITYGGGVKLINSDIELDSCILRKNNQSNSTGTIDMINSNPVIQNCLISDNLGPAILSAANGNSSPQIIGNHLFQNCSSNLNMPQINLGTSSPEDTIRIIDNSIIGMYQNSGGIALSTLAGGTIKAVVAGNQIENNRYGITAYGMNISTIIKNNLIINNDIQGDPMLGGSGINFWGDVTNVSIVTKNEISGNLWGVTVQNQAMPNLGQVTPDTLNPGENLIFDNGNNGETFALYNNTPNALFAENNYWGTFDPDTVEMYIFHQPDDPTLGFVDFLPIKDFFTGTTDMNVGKLSYINVYPNPAEATIFLKLQTPGNSNLRVQMFDFSGRMVYSKILNSISFGIDISFLPDGVYAIVVTTGSESYASKWIKN